MKQRVIISLFSGQSNVGQAVSRTLHWFCHFRLLGGLMLFSFTWHVLGGYVDILGAKGFEDQNNLHKVLALFVGMVELIHTIFDSS